MEKKNEINAIVQKDKKRKLSKEEFRALLPERLNKLGEWLLENKTAYDCGNGKIALKG